MQTEVASKEDLSSLEARVGAEADRVVRSEAEAREDVGNLGHRITQLEAQLADTVYRIGQLSKQVSKTNQELETLLSLIPMGGEGAVPEVVADPEILYEQAYRDYQKLEYETAILGFREYVDSVPENDVTAADALYWLGECYSQLKRYPEAVAEFSAVLSRFPRSLKIPSALLRRGVAYLAMGETDEGITQLQRVLDEYPSHDVAEVARAQLGQLQTN
ncbi:MAG: tetratricopeptide repeat protein [Acidobacteriota bacterium]|nr:tetratricopeptide repeat protein [Acidobacteriota bacterium]